MDPIQPIRRFIIRQNFRIQPCPAQSRNLSGSWSIDGGKAANISTHFKKWEAPDKKRIVAGFGPLILLS